MTRNSFFRKKISVNALELDEHNARIRHGESEADCIAKILRKEDQLLNLMKSIAEDGLSTMPVLVSPSDHNARKWRVWDGNRRVTALKLLNKPKLCKDPATRAKIERIAAGASVAIPRSVECFCSDDQAALIKEVVSRHSGAQEGAGQLGWSPYLRTIFLLGHNQPAEYKRAGLYLCWVEENQIYVADDFPISTLTRFATAENLSLLGVALRDEEVLLTRPKEQVLSIARRLVHDVASTNFVEKVRSPEKAASYVSSILADLNIEGGPDAIPESLRGQSGQNASTGARAKDSDGVSDGAGEPRSSIEGAASDEAESIPSPKPFRGQRSGERTKIFNRKTVGFDVPSDHSKVRDIITEIVTLNHSGKGGAPIAVAFLLRALVELSTKHYMEMNSDIKLKKDDGLRSRVSACARYMRSKNLLSADQMDNVLTHCNATGDMLNITTLQRYIHSTDRFPSGESLNYMWQQIGCYVQACWKSTS